jgi:hypothetical protein
MKKNHSWIRELGLVTVVSSLVLPMFLSGSMAASGDWYITHNWEYVPIEEECSTITVNGSNHIGGSFEWGSSGVSFQYTYDESKGWGEAPADYQSDYYVFDFYTEWNYPYSGLFIILPSLGSEYQYWCTTVET